MANRYWVGGTASWDATAGTKWATTDGGAGGAAVPTSADDVYFTAASGAVTCTLGTSAACGSLNFSGFTGTFSGFWSISIYGSLFISSSMTWSSTGALQFYATSGSFSVTSNGKSLGPTPVVFGLGFTAAWALQDSLTTTGSITVNRGTFTTNNYNVTASSLLSSNSNTRTINLGSSTVTLTSTPVTFATSTGLTFNAGTSSIVCSGASGTFNGGGQTFYNVRWTSTAITNLIIAGSNTFNDLLIGGRTSAGIAAVSISANQTVNGILTLAGGTAGPMRTFVCSDVIGATRTLSVSGFTAGSRDIDFRDISVVGSAAPLTGYHFGDCKGNSGIDFDAPKTVYWNGTGTSWGAATTGTARWALTPGGAVGRQNMPLAQDIAVFPADQPATGGTVSINASYNIGTIDMSARTSNTMTLATGTQTPAIYGNWINGAGTAISGTGVLTFAGRGSQTITSAGKTFSQPLTIDSPSGPVSQLDALISGNLTTALNLVSGIYDANGYNFAASGAISVNGSETRTLALGSGTWTVSNYGNMWQVSGTNVTVTGTGSIRMTSTIAKTFSGGNIQTYPTLVQAGTGTLTITGSNKFADITNTAIGRVQFTGGTTNEFGDFNLNGVSGNLLQVGSTNTTQAILKKPGAWNVGANSTNAGNNTGLTFA